ncbi:hypothetical protein MNBD_PLANCTO03-249 [hydrothermal vent metagenome]|uniref:Uncharacterized protein n=1 Tax=hydrothermal vent metagenome TaxID=652676 RepID=A0A3B1DV68_9ZZZZ
MGMRIGDAMEQAWEQFEPYADASFASELRSALEKHGEDGACMEDREAAWHQFMCRYWELDVGCSLLAHQHNLDSRANRVSAGPDFLDIVDSHRIWIECVVPGRGKGNNAIPEFSDGRCYDVPDDEIKLRLLSAFWDKAKKQEQYLKDGLTQRNEPFVIAINGSCLPDNLTDFQPPRIVRCLLGIQNHQVYYSRSTGEFSEAPMTGQRTISNSNNSQVEATAFQQQKFASISAVLYSDVKPSSNLGEWGGDYVILHNPLATVPLGEDVYQWMTQWRVTRDGKMGTVTRIDPTEGEEKVSGTNNNQ